MIDILIDNSGKAWSINGGILHQNFGASTRNLALPSFLVRNLGFVRVKTIGDSAVVLFAPSRLRVRSYSATAGVLDRLSPTRIRLSWYDDTWHHEIVPDVPASCRRLRLLMRDYSGQAYQNYLSEPRVVEQLPAGTSLSAVLDAWRETGGALTIDRAPRLFRNILRSKFTVVERSSDSGQLVFAEIGEGFVMYKPGWTRRLIGCPVDNQPDFAYGRAVASDWRNAMLAGEPRAVDVDACVRPAGSNNVSHHLRYTRLMLPITLPGETSQLLSATLPDESIDLRGS